MSDCCESNPQCPISLDGTAARLALVGPPNCGKTAMFNALTGSRQKVANYAGVTVERKEGRFKTPMGAEVSLLDLPGTIGLRASSPDEAVSRDVVLGRLEGEQPPEALICVGDATNLLPTLRLCLELKETGKPMMLAVNMADIARARGMEIDVAKLSKLLGFPVVPCVSVRKGGTAGLLEAIDLALPKWKEAEGNKERGGSWREPEASKIREWHAQAAEMLKAVTAKAGSKHRLTENVDKVLLHPVAGVAILLLVLLLMFQAVFAWAVPAMDALDMAFGWLSETLKSSMPEGMLRDFLTDGVIAGVGGVLVFLPQIIILFVFIILLEDSGYMARAAFLMDRAMGGVGLNGRAFIPLLSSFACAIPGIMATRTIQHRRDRLLTIMIAPLMTCSARLPVYTLIVGAMIPDITVGGAFGLQGLVMFALYAIGILGALAVSLVAKRRNRGGEFEPLLLHMPDYKIPSRKNVTMGVALRAWMFIRRAGTVILGLSVVLWLLSNYPAPPEGATGASIDYSLAGTIGRLLAPIMEPIGFSWQMALSLLPAMAAREMAVAAIGTIYAVGGDLSEAASGERLGLILREAWSVPAALSYLVWFVFAPQCLSTLAVVRRETGRAWWAFVMFAYMSAMAYAASFITYRIASALV